MSLHTSSSRPPSLARPSGHAHDVDEVAEEFQGDTQTAFADRALAIRLAREESMRVQQFNADRQLALSLAGGAAAPAPTILNTRGPAATAPIATVPANAAATNSSRDAAKTIGLLHMISAWWYGTGSEDKASTASKSQTPAAEGSRAHEQRLTGHDCVICGDAIRGIEVRTPCGHYYDRQCILDLFQAATRDESLYPPRCCRLKIPLSLVQSYMTSAAINLFNEKGREFGTLKRVYCANPRCSRFLCAQLEAIPWFSTTSVKCTAEGCNTETCSFCKARLIPGTIVPHTCRKDSVDREVLALGERSRWARCPGCETLIELNLGCYHMTCRCKTEFCYVCRAIWKTCRCPQWDETRLLAAAEARVDAQLGIPPARREMHRAQPPVRAVPPPANIAVQPRRIVQPVAHEHDVVHHPLAAAATTARRPQPPPAPVRVNIPTSSTRLAHNPTPTVTASTPRTEPHATTSSSPANVFSRRASVRNAYTSPSDVGNWRRSAATSSSVPQPTRSAQVPNKGKQRERPDRARLVREAVEHLRVNHECDHLHWKYRQGGGLCETCNHTLPLYLFRCGNCAILACNRCRRNRL
ncbi:unnamed protein product [Somion occarium]|uniref:RBR-type E3 ubiquitin transferase n=1 Tax=Somion occarium TaxID=3059160 RepID=A0ABP1DPM4_9APHY